MKINFLRRNYFECNARICKKLNKFPLKQLHTLNVSTTWLIVKGSVLLCFFYTNNLAYDGAFLRK